MILTQTVHTADNEPLAESVGYQGDDVMLFVRRALLPDGGRPPPETLVVHVSSESRRLVRGQVEAG
jgi:hypothetical protein